MTETAQLADVVLPSACFAEKDGTFANTDRRVKMIHLTETGSAFVEETFQSQLQVCLVLLQPLEVEERQELRRLLRKVIVLPG